MFRLKSFLEIFNEHRMNTYENQEKTLEMIRKHVKKYCSLDCFTVNGIVFLMESGGAAAAT